MRNLLLWSEIAVSILLIAVILLQQKGSGLGAAFGGTSQVYRSRRGIEKGLFISTVVLGALFILGAVLNLIIS